jgi:hypothetical protein
MYICFWTSYCLLLLLLLLERGVGLLGPETGVTAALEFWEEAKLAGWKRGKEGSLRWAAGPLLEDWREVGAGRRRACEGMAMGSPLGDRGELTDGMLRAVDIVEGVGLQSCRSVE